MALESGTYIYDLVQANPPAGDQRKEGDDHLRLIKKVVQQTFPHVTGPNLPTSTGTAAAQLITHLFGPPTYIQGMVVAWIAGFTSTGPMTLAVNGLGAKPVFMAGAAIGVGNIVAGSLVVAIYDGIQFQIFGSTGVGGYLPLSGGTLTGNLVINPIGVSAQLTLIAPSGSYRGVFGRTGLVDRWSILLGDTSAETGSNVGSNFAIRRHNDAGTVIDTPLSINRLGGGTTVANLFCNNLTASGFASISGDITADDINCSSVNITGGVALVTGTAGGRTWYTGVQSSGSWWLSDVTAGGTARIIVTAAGTVAIQQDMTVNSALTLTGSNSALIIDHPVNVSRLFQALTSGVLRWQIQFGNGATESGSNVGCDFVINRFGDAGGSLGNPLSIARSSGVATFSAAIVNGPSDRTLKENIQPIVDALGKVKALKGVSFNFIKDKGKRQIGLIAQDVAPIVPEVLQDYLQEDEEPKLAIDYTRLVPMLIEAIKELTARVEELETANA